MDPPNLLLLRLLAVEASFVPVEALLEQIWEIAWSNSAANPNTPQSMIDAAKQIDAPKDPYTRCGRRLSVLKKAGWVRYKKPSKKNANTMSERRGTWRFKVSATSALNGELQAAAWPTV